MRSLFATIALAACTIVAAAPQNSSVIPTRLNLHPTQIRKGSNPDNDHIWVIEEVNSANTTINDVTLTLSGPKDVTLNGDWNKFVYSKFLAMMGERLVGTGVSTKEDTGGSITLTIDGLSSGNHSLLAWHNAWDGGNAKLATVSVTVDGKKLASVCVWQNQGISSTNSCLERAAIASSEQCVGGSRVVCGVLRLK